MPRQVRIQLVWKKWRCRGSSSDGAGNRIWILKDELEFTPHQYVRGKQNTVLGNYNQFSVTKA